MVMKKIISGCFIYLALLNALPARAAETATTNTIANHQLVALITAKNKGGVDADGFKYQLALWVSQRKIIKELNYATLRVIQSADTNISDADIEMLQDTLNPLLSKPGAIPNAIVDFTAANTNFNWSVTNRPLVTTNLAGVLVNQKRLIASLALPPDSPDTNGYATLTNNWSLLGKEQERYAALETNSPSRPYQAFLSSGAEFLNPFVVSVPSATPHGFGTLTNAGHSTVAYVQFDYINRYVLRQTPSSQWTGRSTNYWINRDLSFGGSWVNPLITPPDIQFNVGFLLGNGGNQTTPSYSAQTVASSDFYSQFGLGFPIWQLDGKDQRNQVSLEFAGGVTTEQGFELVHPNAFFGLGYEATFTPIIGSATTNGCGFFVARMGGCLVDYPSLTGNGNQVNLDGNGVPVFKESWAGACGTYLAYPLTQSIYLTVDANCYFGFLGGQPPDSWNIKVGASIPLDKIAEKFSSFLK